MARPVSTIDALAVPEPYAVKVACAVLWGGSSSDAAPLPATAWLSHLDLFGSQLRARHWSRITKDSHPHVSLIEAKNL